MAWLSFMRTRIIDKADDRHDEHRAEHRKDAGDVGRVRDDAEGNHGRFATLSQEGKEDPGREDPKARARPESQAKEKSLLKAEQGDQLAAGKADRPQDAKLQQPAAHGKKRVQDESRAPSRELETTNPIERMP